MGKNIKLAYIILAHKYPSLLSRLVNKLNSQNVGFFIHIDKNIDVKPFIAEFLGNSDINLTFILFLRNCFSVLIGKTKIGNGVIVTNVLDGRIYHFWVYIAWRVH